MSTVLGDLPPWAIAVILALSVVLLVLDVVLRKNGLAKDISSERAGAYKVRFAILGILAALLVVAVLLSR